MTIPGPNERGSSDIDRGAEYERRVGVEEVPSGLCG